MSTGTKFAYFENLKFGHPLTREEGRDETCWGDYMYFRLPSPREKWTCCRAFVTAQEGREKVWWRRRDSREDINDARAIEPYLNCFVRDLYKGFPIKSFRKSPICMNFFPLIVGSGGRTLSKCFSFSDLT